MDPNIKELSIRKAQIDDSDILLTWRNHPQTRAASRNTEKIDPVEHEKWFIKVLKSENRQIFIVEEQGVPVGTVRVDGRKGLREMSWTVAPEQFGRGIGKWMVKKIADQIEGPLKAEIKIDNYASQKIAENAGFAKVFIKGKMIIYQRTP